MKVIETLGSRGVTSWSTLKDKMVWLISFYELKSNFKTWASAAAAVAKLNFSLTFFEQRNFARVICIISSQ